MVFNPRAFAFFILALASLGIAGYMFNNEFSLSSDSFSISLPTGWFVSKTEKYVKAADLVLNGSFSEGLVVNVDKRTIMLSLPSGSRVKIFGIDITYLAKQTLTLKDFSGKIMVMPYKVEIKGDAENVITSIGSISKDNERISFYYNGSYDTLTITSLPYQDIIINQFMGKIEALIKGDRLLYEVSNKNVEIRDYEGYFAVIDGNIELKGTGLIRSDVIEVYARE